jgi:GR25 family glycosyltransferase involved in LPS biosynthesis
MKAFTAILLAMKFLSSAAELPPATVIHLPRCTSRRAHITKELSSIPLFDWMEAVDGYNMTAEDLRHNVTSAGRWFMTKGMMGCFLSHRKCWLKCVEQNSPLVIFEDDVVLAPEFEEKVTRAMDKLVEDSIDWDVLLLGAIGCVHPERKYGFNWVPGLVGGKWRKCRKVAQLETTSNHESVIHAPLRPLGMHAYVLSPQGADKLLQRCPRASYHVDVVAWGYLKLKILALHPLVAWQTHNDTTIAGGSQGKGLRIFRAPAWMGDLYTGWELGWALSAPLLNVGGPLLESCVLTNGSSLAIMFMGLLGSNLKRSSVWLWVTLAYVALVTGLVRFLASEWNA